MKLNLGAGDTKYEGYKNVDMLRIANTDFVVDLEKELPFKDNSIEAVVSNHCFEHIQNLHGLMKELNRVCLPGAELRVVVPFYRSEGAFNNPDHKRFFGPTTFEYYKDLVDVKSVRRVPAFISKTTPHDPLYMIDTWLRRRMGFVWFGRHEGLEFILVNKKEAKE